MKKLDTKGFVPLYHQLKTILEEQIRTGKFNEGDLIPSERKLCKMYKVSNITARRAILELVNDGFLHREVGKGTFVKPQVTKEYVVAFLAMGYSDKSSRTSSNYLYDLLRGIAQEAFRKKISLNMIFPEPTVDIASFLEGITVAKKFDGFLISTLMDIHYEEVKILEEASIPYVIVKRYIPRVKLNCVVSNDVKGASEAVKHLISLGHRRIGFINGPSNKVIIWRDRMEGYKKALDKYDIGFDARLVYEKQDLDQEKNGYEGMMELLKLDKLPTAVFIAGDTMALGAYRAVKKRKLRIPQDIAIVGYDDIEMASILQPPLTTVRTPFFEFGKKSVELLKEIMTQEPSQPKRLVMEPVLVVRESSGIRKKEGEDDNKEKKLDIWQHKS